MNELKVTNENITHTDHIVVNANDINLHISAENTLKQNFTEQQHRPTVILALLSLSVPYPFSLVLHSNIVVNRRNGNF